MLFAACHDANGREARPLAVAVAVVVVVVAAVAAVVAATAPPLAAVVAVAVAAAAAAAACGFEPGPPRNRTGSNRRVKVGAVQGWVWVRIVRFGSSPVLELRLYMHMCL